MTRLLSAVNGVGRVNALRFGIVLLLLSACGKTISDAPPRTAPCTGEQCAAPAASDGAGDLPNDGTNGGTNDATNDGTSDVDEDEPQTRACTATECVDGDGFCDVGFCAPCVRDEDCGDAPVTDAPDDSTGDEPGTPGDTPEPGDGPGLPSDLPECLEGECVEGDGFCDEQYCSTCPSDADCASDPSAPGGPSDPSDPSDPNDPGAQPGACIGDEDCACLADECIAGDGFCDEDWCDCPDDPDCNDDANERCVDDEDCCLPDECIAGDGFCDEDLCQGCEVDPDC